MAGVIAYMLLVTETGKEHEIIKEVRRLKGVTECRAVYGEFDVFVRLEVDDLTALDEIVTQVRRIPGTIQSTTLVGSP
ncbi:MAG: Lrp/AsnC ligand binding domain-containing protein [Candidatus Verstraetearchaeota archaeon]|nr:Lrp/AsnC ligand binding domain-containing protein [Candidatus Verstraetearchaeota archaeon]